ncbi:twin-arginine translocase subunit TatC [Microtetraspora sp. NBRC 13810]|uniref:twin-arginine translocase subunit TatC n=1 Tax=Microtetraspora sp. NBRC 13810 TaxID=3030990 RepID=UPI0025548DC4|nr:twin-arginine translocase subunit TatC [Microtetraspora sp. NBRC 13810]
MEHLRELRNRLVKSLLALVAGTIIGFLFFDQIYTFITRPYCGLPQDHMLRPGQCSLAVQGVFDAFLINLKIAALFGIVVSSPVWLYQLWSFVTPGLYRNERRYSMTFLALAIPLFLAGAALSYIVMDTGLTILLGFAPPDSVLIITITEFVNYVLIMLLVFGISFELPLLMVFLNVIGVLKHATVKKHRRMVIFVMFVFAGVATPGTDPFTMVMLAAPMVILFALAELFMYLREKRLPAGEDYSSLSDEEASPLDLGATDSDAPRS